MPRFRLLSDTNLAPGEPESDCLFLQRDTWNDFNYQTQFSLLKRNATGNLKRIGKLKILKKNARITPIPEEFEYLGDDYCSIGQSSDYYKSIQHQNNDTLTALNDLTAKPELLETFRDEQGLERSLLRFLAPARALELAKTGKTPNVSFSFRTHLHNFSKEHHVAFDFESQRFLNRIILIAGNNGCGKSGVLANLAYAISGERPDAGTFEPTRPLFSRVVVLSYGIFQPFKSISSGHESYIYCGLTSGDPREILEPKAMGERHLAALSILKRKGRIEQWNSVWKELCKRSELPTDHTNTAGQLSLLNTMSSGHRIYAQVAIDLICHIEQQTLVLFDEPEIHLHPSLSAHLMRMISSLLEANDSFAVIATHSPIVVQEVPASSVRIFERNDTTPVVYTPNFETFGATLSEISDSVFKTSKLDRNYLTLLTDLSSRFTNNEIRSRFLRTTSLNLDVALPENE